MNSGSDWYCQEAVLVQAARRSGWTAPVEPAVPGFAEWRELRRGGQGVVYSATQLSTHRRVAVKVLLGGPLASRDQLRRFDREIDLIAGFQHPHIVRLYDRGLTDHGLPYYVMELIDGVALDGVIGPSVPDLRTGLELFAKICEAVGYAHERGIIHRDLKPGNILIDRDGEPHVLDFGLAKSVMTAGQSSWAVVSRTGDFMGSLPWASPKQADGVPERIDARSDVYSLGVVLHQILTGRFPYPIGGLHETIENIRNAEPARPSRIGRQGRPRGEISPELDAIVLKCLAKQPEQRYPDAGTLAQDIRCYLRGEPVAARFASRAHRVWTQMRRHSTVIGVAGALVISGVAISIALLRSSLHRGATAGTPGKAGTVFELADKVVEIDGALTFFAHELPDVGAVFSIPGNLALGHAGAAGAHTVAGGRRLEATKFILVGYDGPGQLTIRDGGKVVDWDGSIGHAVQGRGTVTLAGAGSRWDSQHSLYLGYRGQGTLSISAASHVTAGESALGVQPGAEGRIAVDGRASTWATHLSAVIGVAGAGALRITNGGSASAAFSSVAQGPESRGEVVVVGDGSTWMNRSSIYVGGVASCAGGEARVLIDDGAAVSACHLLRIFGGGRVSFSGGMLSADTCENTLDGTFEFTGGRLHVNHFVGDLVTAGGTLALAHSPGVMQVAGNYQQDDGVLELRIHGRGSGDWDVLVVDGTATLGGHLAILCADGFVPAYEDRLTILTATAINGRFQNGQAQIELLGDGRCDIVYSDTQVFLTRFEGPFATDPTTPDVFPGGPLPRPILPNGPCPRQLSQNTTREHDLVFLGPPDAIGMGLAGQMVEYDFDDLRVVDGPGPDFNVYELPVGTAEYDVIDVQVSLDGVTFVSVKSANTSVVRIPGDGAWPDQRFGVSYDLAGSGLKRVRYIRIDGDGNGLPGAMVGFDLDAIAAVHLAPAGEPPVP